MALPAPGPLEVLATNPIYFTPDGATPVCLAGAHTWANLQDFGGGQPNFNFDAYLTELRDHGHNAIRLWCWPGALNRDQTGLSPHPWPRTTQGTANDGGHKFDVSRFDDVFFQRLYDRVQRARDRGIYVIVMLFQYYSSNQSGWPYLPSNLANNVNGVNDRLITDDGVVTDFQKTYGKRFLDQLNPLDNVLWEVGNEIPAASLAWETNIVNLLRGYENSKPKRHLIGVNSGYGNLGASLQQLLNTGADYVALLSPSKNSYVPPPSAFGRPVLADSDHQNQPLNTTSGNVKVNWAWVSFTRGYHPIDMEALQVRLPGYNASWNDLSNPSFPSARQAMGAVLQVAHYAPLASMMPLETPGEVSFEVVPSQTIESELAKTKSSPVGEDTAATAVSPGYFVLADEDPTQPFYIAYSEGGAIFLDLSGIGGQLWWRTLDPRTAATTSGPSAIQGGNRRQEFKPPTGVNGSWVLILSRLHDPAGTASS